MKIQKRTILKYIVLNILTLGIYGVLVSNQMHKETSFLCKGDRQSTGYNYLTALVASKVVPGLGGIYYNYMWYQQANRLQLNAGRYDMRVKESGTDIFLMRTALNIPLLPLTIVSYVASLLVPVLLAVLLGMLVPVLGIIVAVLAVLVLLIFGNELSAGAMLANYFMMKNLNRFAAVYRNGAADFDPMAYEYYPCVANRYPEVAATLVGANVKREPDWNPDDVNTDSETGFGTVDVYPVGILLGEKGTCAGYKFDLVSGEEVLIGKDAKVAHVLIDPAYKDISRKHVGVTYDAASDCYAVVDYSSNGTWANETKLNRGEVKYVPHGTILRLANGKNQFQLV